MTLTGEYQQIVNPLGLHLRAGRHLVELANQFESVIEIEKRGGPKINAKSILGVLLLEGIQGTEIRVMVTGSDSKEALKAITDLISNGFGDI